MTLESANVCVVCVLCFSAKCPTTHSTKWRRPGGGGGRQATGRVFSNPKKRSRSARCSLGQLERTQNSSRNAVLYTRLTHQIRTGRARFGLAFFRPAPSARKKIWRHSDKIIIIIARAHSIMPGALALPRPVQQNRTSAAPPRSPLLLLCRRHHARVKKLRDDL